MLTGNKIATGGGILSKKSFTLSEVLITLVVIGIIAAITVPNIIQQNKRTRVETQLKKFYSTMSNAVRLSEIQNGISTAEVEFNGGKDAGEKFFKEYLAPYLNYMKIDCKYKNESGQERCKVYMNDGSTFTMWNHYIGFAGGVATRCVEMYYDTNDTRGPNTDGKDIFNFFLCNKLNCFDSNGKQVCIDSFGTFPAAKDLTRNQVKYYCSSKNNGRYCTELIYRDGWKFSKDYPLKI